ncbi:MAG: DUF86 domain-containing protein [Candidatus Methanofastidiosia archaeon]
MKRTYRDYIEDILNSIQEIEDFTAGMEFEDFIDDRKTLNAVIRSLEVMGEAAKKIPNDIRTKYADIPWKYIAGMRDKLIHEYHGVDLEIVWEVIKKEIPPIKPLFEKILKEMKE